MGNKLEFSKQSGKPRESTPTLADETQESKNGASECEEEEGEYWEFEEDCKNNRLMGLKQKQSMKSSKDCSD